MNKDKIIVVEGIRDAAKIKEIYPNQIIYTSNGSEIAKEILKTLKNLEKTHEIILFFDPDYQGERIRKIISSHLKQAQHAFINKEDAINKRKNKVGVEHASHETIKQALNNLLKENQLLKSDCDTLFLYENKIIGHKDSKKLRQKITTKLNIGQANGKTLLLKLRQFNINKKDIIEVLNDASI